MSIASDRRGGLSTEEFLGVAAVLAAASGAELFGCGTV
jgi:hypothetical protein